MYRKTVLAMLLATSAGSAFAATNNYYARERLSVATTPTTPETTPTTPSPTGTWRYFAWTDLGTCDLATKKQKQVRNASCFSGTTPLADSQCGPREAITQEIACPAFELTPRTLTWFHPPIDPGAGPIITDYQISTAFDPYCINTATGASVASSNCPYKTSANMGYFPVTNFSMVLNETSNPKTITVDIRSLQAISPRLGFLSDFCSFSLSGAKFYRGPQSSYKVVCIKN